MFPAGSPKAGRSAGNDDGHLARPSDVPDEMWAAVESVRVMTRINNVRYREIPVPSTLADYGIGVELESGGATGWLMVLYNLRPRTDWNSCWRCVAFARLPLEAPENDSLAPGMYWDTMCDYLDGAQPDSMSGTVTVTQNTAFGATPGPATAGCELRVSWTPLDRTGPDATMDAGSQVRSWAAFIASTVREESPVD
ncbi:hypothetical protein G1C95_0289 [Bifidobacterium sp. DSM 109957]|uniref:Permease n=1 Tax=Bifidobacterium oedipodis TaxID=2675322 RepID=A0A7Y0EMP7_9BIFI|nr:hypothetical protein [Bifidobacterium sp. DSM 109957]